MEKEREQIPAGGVTYLLLAEWMAKFCILFPVILAGLSLGNAVRSIVAGVLLWCLVLGMLRAWMRPGHDFLQNVEAHVGRKTAVVLCAVSFWYFLAHTAVFARLWAALFRTYLTPNIPAAVLCVLPLAVGLGLLWGGLRDRVRVSKRAGIALLVLFVIFAFFIGNEVPIGAYRQEGVNPAASAESTAAQVSAGDMAEDSGDANAQVSAGSMAAHDSVKDMAVDSEDAATRVSSGSIAARTGGLWLSGLAGQPWINRVIDILDGFLRSAYEIFLCMGGMFLPFLAPHIAQERRGQGTSADTSTVNGPVGEQVLLPKEPDNFIAGQALPTGDSDISRAELPSGDSGISRIGLPTGDSGISRAELPTGDSDISRAELSSAASGISPAEARMGRAVRLAGCVCAAVAGAFCVASGVLLTSRERWLADFPAVEAIRRLRPFGIDVGNCEAVLVLLLLIGLAMTVDGGVWHVKKSYEYLYAAWVEFRHGQLFQEIWKGTAHRRETSADGQSLFGTEFSDELSDLPGQGRIRYYGIRMTKVLSDLPYTKKISSYGGRISENLTAIRICWWIVMLTVYVLAVGFDDAFSALAFYRAYNMQILVPVMACFYLVLSVSGRVRRTACLSVPLSEQGVSGGERTESRYFRKKML